MYCSVSAWILESLDHVYTQPFVRHRNLLTTSTLHHSVRKYKQHWNIVMNIKRSLYVRPEQYIFHRPVRKFTDCLCNNMNIRTVLMSPDTRFFFFFMILACIFRTSKRYRPLIIGNDIWYQVTTLWRRNNIYSPGAQGNVATIHISSRNMPLNSTLPYLASPYLSLSLATLSSCRWSLVTLREIFGVNLVVACIYTWYMYLTVLCYVILR